MAYITPREYLSPPRTIPKPKFYPDGYVWIVDAINEAGEAVFGSDWTGNESIARNLPALPDNPSLADLLIGATKQKRPIDKHVRGPIRAEIITKVPTPEEYTAEQRAGDRFARATDWIRQRVFSGDLHLSLLQSDWHDIPPNIVATDKEWSGIIRPQVTPEVHLALPGGQRAGPVFLDRGEFQAQVKSYLTETGLDQRRSPGRKTDTDSQRMEIIDAFLDMVSRDDVSFERGGQAAAVDLLHESFPRYKRDSIKRIISGEYKEAKERHLKG